MTHGRLAKAVQIIWHSSYLSDLPIFSPKIFSIAHKPDIHKGDFH